MTVEPIRPEEVENQKIKAIPSFVIAAVNELIIENFNGSVAYVPQKELVARIKEKHRQEKKRAINADTLFNNNWLDVEPLFRSYGWKVHYDKPGYNESYEPTFTFTQPK